MPLSASSSLSFLTSSSYACGSRQAHTVG
jgi:hypothetical protein